MKTLENCLHGVFPGFSLSPVRKIRRSREVLVTYVKGGRSAMDRAHRSPGQERPALMRPEAALMRPEAALMGPDGGAPKRD